MADTGEGGAADEVSVFIVVFGQSWLMGAVVPWYPLIGPGKP